MKKVIVAILMAIVMVLGIGQIAQAKEVRSTSASAIAEETAWKSYLDTWVTTDRGNQFYIHEGRDNRFTVLFEFEEDLGEVEGVKLEDAKVTYYFNGMNNGIVEYLMTY